MSQVKLLVLSGGDLAGVPATMSDDQIRYAVGRDVWIQPKLAERCGIGTGWGPWVCIEPSGHREHRCHQHRRPAVRLCTLSGCGAPICDKSGCHPTHSR